MTDTNYFDPGYGEYLIVDGQVVARDALGIAERITEYDENLYLVCLEPDLAEVNDAPFIVLERLEDGRSVRVMEAWQLDERILERLYNADTKRVDVLLNMDKTRAQQKKDTLGRYQEKRDANKELMLDILKSPQSQYSIKDENTGDTVKFFENRPPERNNAKKSF